jgi:hypothetical protein
VWQRVADGTLSLRLLKRLCRNITSSASGTRASSLDRLQRAGRRRARRPVERALQHWLQNLADETGYTGDQNHVDMKVAWARALGISDEGSRAVSAAAGERRLGVHDALLHAPLLRGGLAAFGWAGERFAASTNYAKLMYEGMRDYYGMEIENFRVHAYAEGDHGNRRLPPPPGGADRRPAAPRPPRHRARAALPQRPHRRPEPLARRAGRAAPKPSKRVKTTKRAA